jgi:hypothetical protein
VQLFFARDRIRGATRECEGDRSCGEQMTHGDAPVVGSSGLLRGV